MIELTKEEQKKKDLEEKAKEFSALMESKLRKAENHTWMLKDLEYLEQ